MALSAAADALPPFDRVVDEHGAVVMRVCRAVLSPADAEDAWSETFLSALKAYPELPPGSNIRAWLITIAHRRAIDQHRRVARAPRPASGSIDEPVAPGREVPEATGAHGDIDPELLIALRRLPPKQRSAVACRYLADLSYADIAQLIGCSEAAARRSAADGIAALRRQISAIDQGATS